MQIIIPMAGLGERFTSEGYTEPKPLIKINGLTMIELVLKSLMINGRFIFVVRPELDINSVHYVIKKNVREYEFVITEELTEGPACSVLLCENKLNKDDELIVANCDQIMEWDGSSFLNAAKNNDGTVVTYYSQTPKNSYARLNKFNKVTEIKEKEVISNISLNGIHYWRKAKFFIDSAHKMIEADDRAPNGEFYVGPTYNYMISEGLSVGIYHIPKDQHHAVGTPTDLKRYLKNA